MRPTVDRVRESLFNRLSHGFAGDLEGEVLDVFAGSGALGLEALSRGAKGATFIENGRKSLALLRENIRLLGADARVVSRDARKPGPGQPHGLIFMDPPYDKGLGERALPQLIREGWVAPGALLVWEERTPPPTPADWTLLDARRYGETRISLMRYEEGARA